MLRMLFASGLLLAGAIQSLRGPFYALLFYLFIAYFRPETWVWSDDLQALNLSFFVGLYVVVSTFLYGERIRLNAPVILILLFCLHGLISSLLSPYSDWCMIWWQGFAKVSLITILIVSLVNTEERLRLTLVVIAFALGFEGVKQGLAYLILGIQGPNLNALEILGDNNGVAVGMLMLAAILLALLQATPKLWQKSMYAVMLIGVVFRSLTTYSRGGLLAFAAMCGMYWARSRHRVRTAIMVGGLALLLLPLLPEEYWRRMETLTTERDTMDSSAGGRLHFWETALEMANDHPLLGVGTMGFQRAYDEYDTSAGRYGQNRAVHSTWFGVLADQGYVGLVMLVSLVVWAFLAAGRARALARGVPGREAVFAYAAALQTALVTAIVGGSFLSYHYVEILWHFVGLSFAVHAIAKRQAENEAANEPIPLGAQPMYQAS
jgi:putative inorganic carbon (HCO3(-)) transporter